MDKYKQFLLFQYVLNASVHVELCDLTSVRAWIFNMLHSKSSALLHTHLGQTSTQQVHHI